MEEVQFAATLHYLKQQDAIRGGSAGLIKSNVGANGERGMAWAIRTLFQAACATPDADTVLRTEFLNSVKSNIEYLHARYVARPHNPYGFISPYADYTPGDHVFLGAIWQQDFVTGVIGYGLSMRLGVDSATATKWDEFFRWKAQSVVGRFGGTAANEYLYRDAAPYTMAFAPTDTPDWEGGTGPWFVNWGALYDATWAAPRVALGPRTEGGLRGSYFPSATSYWGNMQPALAYAVQHGVPGASAAYARMTSAANWSTFVEDCNVNPVWSVMPRT
jgi:hypothetical protein